MAADLGEAIGLQSKATAPTDKPLTGAVDYAIRARMNREAQSAKRDEKQNEEFNKIAHALDVSKIHTKLQKEVSDKVTGYIQKMRDKSLPVTERMSAADEATKYVADMNVLSEDYKKTDAIPYNTLGVEGKRKMDIWNSTAEAKDLPLGLSPQSGQGVGADRRLVVHTNKYVNLDDAMNKTFNDVKFHGTSVGGIKNHKQLIDYAYDPKNVATAAETLWNNDKGVRDTYLDQNSDYINKKFVAQKDEMSNVARPGELYNENGVVQNDLKRKFIDDYAQNWAKTKGKEEYLSIPKETSAGSGKTPPKEVDFQTTDIPRSNAGDYKNIMDSSDGVIKVTRITTPKEGESKPLELPANGFFFIGKDGKKKYVKTNTVKGIPTSVMSSSSSKGGKQGVIEVTDISLSPEEYLRKSYEETPGVKINTDGQRTWAEDADGKYLETVPANTPIKLKGYIPLTKDNANKLHSEYSMYGKTDFNGTVSKVHGVQIGSGGNAPAPTKTKPTWVEWKKQNPKGTVAQYKNLK